jgi:feruloyl esterase
VPAFDFDSGPRRIAATAAVAGFSPELARFRTLGGRLILYHGAMDESLMPAHTLAYWQAAEQRFGAEPLADFARFFLVPGMRHCGGGPGATEVDWLTALERWVEQDEPPAELLAYRRRGARRGDAGPARVPPAPASVEFARPVYPYPEVTLYKGEGDPARPESFKPRGPAPGPGLKTPR